MTSRSRTPLIVAAVLVLVLIVGLIVVVTGGDDDDDASPGAPAGTQEDASTVPDDGLGGAASDPTLPEEIAGELRPVTVVGNPLPPLEDGAEDAAVGQPAPVLTGESFDGTAVTTAADGGPVMLVVLAHWCPHCNDEIPRVIELGETGRLPEGLRVVGISTAVAPNQANFPPSQWIADKGWPFEIMADYVDFSDGSFVASAALGVTAFPFVTIVGADGNVAARWSGGSDIDDLEAKINAAVG